LQGVSKQAANSIIDVQITDFQITQADLTKQDANPVISSSFLFRKGFDLSQSPHKRYPENVASDAPDNASHVLPFAPALLEVLVCPVTRTKLIYDEDGQRLISEAAGLAFPIRDGIAILLVEDAEKLAR